jgi:hypothetical protein
MHPPGTPKSADVALHQLWRQVCASRGTPAPDPALLGGFLQGLGTHEREKLQSVLLLAARGREPPGELSLISWAAACTRPALFDQLAARGLAFTGSGLFACGLKLREEGWDIQQRLAQLQSNPGDVDTLRAWLPVAPREHEAVVQPFAPPARQAPEADGEVFNPWLDHGPLEGNLPDWHEEPVGDVPPMPDLLAALPVLPTRFARQRLDALPSAANASGAPPESRLRLRLFGKSAAHTLEVTPHRRGGDFLGVHVVSIDSAHALSAGGGYAWERKLVIQLTPEEMPALIATLMGLTPSVRFDHHGAGRDKFVEVRRQQSGLVMVTGEKALSFSVPVPTASLYYVLDLFCRAMGVDKPGRSVSEVLMLVRSTNGV